MCTISHLKVCMCFNKLHFWLNSLLNIVQTWQPFLFTCMCSNMVFIKACFRHQIFLTNNTDTGLCNHMKFCWCPFNFETFYHNLSKNMASHRNVSAFVSWKLNHWTQLGRIFYMNIFCMLSCCICGWSSKHFEYL